MEDYTAGVDKEFYFRKAERYIAKYKLKDLLKIDKNRFGYTKDTVMVYFRSFYRKGHARRWQEIKRNCISIKEYEYSFKDENYHIHQSYLVHPFIEFRKVNKNAKS